MNCCDLNCRTSLIGFAIAEVLLPANRRPTARGAVAASSTMSEPESPELRNELLRSELQDLVDRICNRRGAAAGEQETNRARGGGGVLHHERTGVAGVEE